MNIPLARPDITELEREAVLKVLQTPYLSLGPNLKEFEEKIANYVGVKYGIAVNSGTSALHLIVRALGIGEGDKVITTPFSFVASSNCLLFEGAEPIFVDIDPETLNLDPNKVEDKIKEYNAKSSNVKAILVVDVFGQTADWDDFKQIAEKYDLLLIEDSAEALGAEYKGRKVGTFGEAGVFAFYPNKQITTGEGGVIVTDDKEIASLCRSMRNQGRGEGDKWLQHTRLGYNYRISDINCALGIAQLDRIDKLLRKREQVAQMYNQRLENIKGVKIPYVSPDVKMSWFVYVVRLDDEYSREDRDRVLQGLTDAGIGCRNYFPPIHLQPFYREKFGYSKGDFPITEQIASRTIALPFYNDLTEREIDYVIENLSNILKPIH